MKSPDKRLIFLLLAIIYLYSNKTEKLITKSRDYKPNQSAITISSFADLVKVMNLTSDHPYLFKHGCYGSQLLSDKIDLSLPPNSKMDMIFRERDACLKCNDLKRGDYKMYMDIRSNFDGRLDFGPVCDEYSSSKEVCYCDIDFIDRVLRVVNLEEKYNAELKAMKCDVKKTPIFPMGNDCCGQLEASAFMFFDQKTSTCESDVDLEQGIQKNIFTQIFYFFV